MGEKAQLIPLSEDALNRFRITHSDRELRPLLRRLHRLPMLATQNEASPGEAAIEVEMAKLELLKWKVGVERIMGSVANLQRQKEVYERRAAETVRKTEELKATLENEKLLLVRRQRERDHQIQCDEIASRILARGKSRAELDDQIRVLEGSIAEHRASHDVYVETVQTRIDLFSQITKLLDEVRNTKLPIDPQSTLPVDETPAEASDQMDVDEPPSTSAAASTLNVGGSSNIRLNASALPFQPTTTTTSAPASRSHTPPPPSTTTLKPPTTHALPSRPARTPASTSSLSATSMINAVHRVPSRPSTLRSVTVPMSSSSLEEGELGTDDDGEPGEIGSRSSKRSVTGSGDGRNTRSRPS